MSKESISSKAKKIAKNYKITIEQNKESSNSGFIGSSVELPSISVKSTTVEKCYIDTKKALNVAILKILESNRKPQGRNRTDKRTKQVNIRFTLDEKALLNSFASNIGLKDNLSTLLRHIILEYVFRKS